jgi:hypothetical protein
MVNGLEIRSIECTGAGRRVGPGRYERFRCSVTSEPLTIPTATLVISESGKLPGVVESRPRLVGPFRALLTIRVTGRRAIAYRQVT